MKIHIKFFTILFLKSIFYVFIVMASLAFLMNLLSELDFFRQIDVDINFVAFLALLNSPSMIFEMFPFIFLVATQLFFIKLFEHKEIEILKYSGFKNSKIIFFLLLISFISSLIVSFGFYNISSNLKNIYLELKSNYTNDGKYLAVVTKNGLWIKDKVENKTLIINSKKVDQNFLIGNFISEFDNNFNIKRNIKSKKIDISSTKWIIYDAKIYKENEYEKVPIFYLKTNFDYKRIQTLYSNLSSLDFFELYELRENYKRLNYSITDINLQILKLFSYPVYLVLMSIFSSLIMLNIKNINSSTFKISIGLFFSVVIYYLYNFFHVLGSTERIPLIISIAAPLLILTIINNLMLYRVNEK
ncbi:LptF/LptG family permease [Candidatus Pelagibacter sp.]|nr:LptF/LptG family permease [Candidatus Pelagibacter sp.]